MSDTGQKSSDLRQVHAPSTALARSIVYEALAIALRDPREMAFDKLRDPECSQAVLDAAAMLDTEAEQQAEKLMAPAIELCRQCRDTSGPTLYSHYARLFGHTARGKVTAYETEYGELTGFRQTQELADISGFYEAFGLSIGIRGRERADHVAAELEFLAFIHRHEHHKLAAGNTDAAHEVNRAGRLFITDHFGHFGRAFACALATDSDHPLYRATAWLLTTHLMCEFRRCGLDGTAPLVTLRSSEEAEVPAICGSCELNTRRDQA